MVDYRWEISFILNGARCKDVITRNNWKVEELTPLGRIERVKVTYLHIESSYRDYWDVYDYGEKLRDEFLDAMASGTFFSLDNIYFPDFSDFEVKLVNEGELRKLGKRVPSRSLVTFRYRRVINPSGLQTILANICRISSASQVNLLRHILTLYRKGLTYDDVSLKFFTLWRAFNAFYNSVSNLPYESQRIKDSVKSLGSNDFSLLIRDYSNVPADSGKLSIIVAGNNYNLYKYLANSNLIDDHNNDRSQELGQALQRGIPEEIIEATLMCLYAIRCKIAHGSDSVIVSNEDLLFAGTAFLSSLLSCLSNKLA